MIGSIFPLAVCVCANYVITVHVCAGYALVYSVMLGELKRPEKVAFDIRANRVELVIIATLTHTQAHNLRNHFLLACCAVCR